MGRKMGGRTSAEENLRTFRRDFHGCMRRRANALFELADAILSASPVPSLPHLSLAPVHRRGWCSLYAALAKGRIDDGGVRKLLARRARVGHREKLPDQSELVLKGRIV